MFDDSYIELSKDALSSNLHFIQSLLPKGCTFSSVIKGNAYGHGVELFVPLAEQCGIGHFSVFSADEAWEVHQVKDEESTLMIMGMVEGDALEWAVLNGVEVWIFDVGRLEEVIEIARRVGKKARVHLEAETGMNRNGLEFEVFDRVIELVKANKAHLEVAGLCTHFAGAESISNHYRIEQQKQHFNHARDYFTSAGVEIERLHQACSAAVIRYPETCLDMARVGIMQYGFFPTREIRIQYTAQNGQDLNPLARVISWKSSVMAVKDVKRGEFVGYGTSFQAGEDMTIATVPVGYWHGFSRSMSNLGKVIINGKRAQVTGVVNMNMISVDVTHVPNVQKGDEVVLIGNQADEEITVSSFSDFSDQVNYELLTRLPENIPRLLV